MSANSITFTGSASVIAYQQALRSVSYQNTATEPNHAQRQITYQVNDGQFSSNVLEGTITIALVNDNPLVLMCPSSSVFSENAQVPVDITQDLVLSDLDQNHIVTGARIEIMNAMSGDKIAINSSTLAVQTLSDSVIQISGEATATDYQVRKNTLTMMSVHYYYNDFLLTDTTAYSLIHKHSK